MKIQPTSLAGPVEALKTALADRADALAAVQVAASPTDRVSLSPVALARVEGATPGAETSSLEEAVTDAVASRVGTEAAAALLEAEQVRQGSLMFVLAHHGPPLR